MAYAAKIVLDSVSGAGVRLTTMEVTFPRFVLAEFNTHRVLSRNSASSRAIPVKKQLRSLLSDPYVPQKFGRNQRGMQSYEYLEGLPHDEATRIWLRARDRAATSAFELLLGEKLSSDIFGYHPEWGHSSIKKLEAGFDDAIRHAASAANDEQLETTSILDVHKQFANRLLEPFMWQTVIITATEWSNFFALRANPEAQPEIRSIAEMMRELYREQQPTRLAPGQWHLPFIQPEEIEWAIENIEQAKKVSAARCARVSYLTHDGKRDVAADLQLYERLAASGHMSPLEHVATPCPHACCDRDTASPSSVGEWHGNFRGWKQLRKFIPNEHDFSLVG